jgi:hypothetical protein
MRRRTAIPILPAILVLALAAGVWICPVASATKPAETLARPWRLLSSHSPERPGVWIAVEGGYCYGEGRPYIDHVKVVERGPAPGRHRGRATITVFEHYPPIKGELCEGIGLTLERFVPLRRPAADLLLYDGSSRPPRLIAGGIRP